ncbi:MAG: putative metal-binding motif-containing protein [Kofleriaceae bacterium]
MRALAGLLVAIAVAGCGEDRVRLEIAGDATGATRLDVVFLEPVVHERKQRSNLPGPSGLPEGGTERVYYAVQRAAATIELAPQDRFPLTIQLDAGFDGRYLPLVVASDAEQRIVAIGALSPPQLFPAEPTAEHATAFVEPRADVTIFEIALERVTVVEPEPGAVPAVPVDHALVVRCGGEPSGLVWRRANGQLRVVLPLDGGKDAMPRLADGIDLDCDESTPGISGDARRVPASDDRKDCDDTSAAFHPGAAEACNGIDDDCDGEVAPLAVEHDCPLESSRCSTVRVCDDTVAHGSTGVCQAPGSPCLRCKPALESRDSGQAKRACGGRGRLELPGCIGACRATLVDAPAGWEVEIGPLSDPSVRFGMFDRFDKPINESGVALYLDSDRDWPSSLVTAGTFAIFVETPANQRFVVPYEISLDLVLPETSSCSNATQIACQ